MVNTCKNLYVINHFQNDPKIFSVLCRDFMSLCHIMSHYVAICRFENYVIREILLKSRGRHIVLFGKRVLWKLKHKIMSKTVKKKIEYHEEGSESSSSEEDVRHLHDLLKSFLKPEEPKPIYVGKDGKFTEPF